MNQARKWGLCQVLFLLDFSVKGCMVALIVIKGKTETFSRGYKLHKSLVTPCGLTLIIFGGAGVAGLFCVYGAKGTGKMASNNLHDLEIRTDCMENEKQADNGVRLKNETVEDLQVVFKNHKEHLIKVIRYADAVVGCVAWLTDFDIIHELSKKDEVYILVQKEDFLRPESGGNWKARLRAAYEKLPKDFWRHGWPGLTHYNQCTGSNDPIMCVGNYNRDKDPAFPRMHNKFIIGVKNYKKRPSETAWAYGDPCLCAEKCVCDKERGECICGNNKTPQNVDDESSCNCGSRQYMANWGKSILWTGSYNFTQNATRSFENALMIRDKKVIKAYYDEFVQIAGFAEALDWSSDWAAPDFRIGT